MVLESQVPGQVASWGYRRLLRAVIVHASGSIIGHLLQHARHQQVLAAWQSSSTAESVVCSLDLRISTAMGIDKKTRGVGWVHMPANENIMGEMLTSST